MKIAKSQLSDAENDAVMTELRRLYDELGNYRAVGEALRFPVRSASQTIRAALVERERAGREIADRLYSYLKTTRERFLTERGITTDSITAPEPTVERVQKYAALEEVLRDLEWPDAVDSATADKIVAAARGEASYRGDRPHSVWKLRIDELIREFTGRAKSVHKREAVESPEERDARELAEERARRKAAREARAKRSQ